MNMFKVIKINTHIFKFILIYFAQETEVDSFDLVKPTFDLFCDIFLFLATTTFGSLGQLRIKVSKTVSL